MSIPEAAAVAAGWYPDPTSRHVTRFWDGMVWTPKVADMAPPRDDRHRCPQGSPDRFMGTPVASFRMNPRSRVLSMLTYIIIALYVVVFVGVSSTEGPFVFIVTIVASLGIVFVMTYWLKNKRAKARAFLFEKGFTCWRKGRMCSIEWAEVVSIRMGGLRQYVNGVLIGRRHWLVVDTNDGKRCRFNTALRDLTTFRYGVLARCGPILRVRSIEQLNKDGILPITKGAAICPSGILVRSELVPWSELATLKASEGILYFLHPSRANSVSGLIREAERNAPSFLKVGIGAIGNLPALASIVRDYRPEAVQDPLVAWMADLACAA
jgi:hypothetical protein